MGGKLRSSLKLERQRAEKLRLQREIEVLRQQLQGLRSAQAGVLSTSTRGIRETFAAEVSAALDWNNGASKIDNRVTESAELAVLRQLYAQLEPVVKEGQHMVTQLLRCFSMKGDEMASQLAHRLVKLQMTIAKHAGECVTWFPKEVAGWSAKLEQASHLYDEEQLGAATEKLNVLETNIEQTVAKARELSAQHQSRMFLLKAIRQVCCNLGMREVAPPRQEQLNDPSSRILLTVASPDRGKLSLALTLDGIHSQGENPKCWKDLDHLSGHLADRYGIQTKFRRPADHDEPTLTGGQKRRSAEDLETLSKECED